MVFLNIHQKMVTMAAAAMLYLLYRALQSLLSRGIIFVLHRRSRTIYGEMMYMKGL